MIVVQDRIDVPCADLARLQQMFHDRYVPTAQTRGLTFVEALSSPPVNLQEGRSTLWLRWQVRDAQAWWAMRASSGTPEVVAFWAAVDALCLSRERVYLAAGGAGDLPAPQDVSRFAVGTRGYRETAQLALRDGLPTGERAGLVAMLASAAQQLPGLETVHLGENMAPEYAAGHYTWDLLYPDCGTAQAARDTAYWQTTVAPALNHCCRAVHAVALDTIGAGLRRAGLAGGIKRTAFFRLLPGTSASVARRFERDHLAMAGQIVAIRNWRLSRAKTLPWDTADGEPWTYVWEQEYDNIEGLTRDYMMHPYHWAYIDRWYDPESGAQVVDVDLSHAFCPLAESLLAREARA